MERVHEITWNFQETRKNEFGSQKKNLIDKIYWLIDWLINVLVFVCW